MTHSLCRGASPCWSCSSCSRLSGSSPRSRSRTWSASTPPSPGRPTATTSSTSLWASAGGRCTRGGATSYSVPGTAGVRVPGPGPGRRGRDAGGAGQSRRRAGFRCAPPRRLRALRDRHSGWLGDPARPAPRHPRERGLPRDGAHPLLPGRGGAANRARAALVPRRARCLNIIERRAPQRPARFPDCPMGLRSVPTLRRDVPFSTLRAARPGCRSP